MRKIFPREDFVKDVVEGEEIGIGYPNIHLVCRVMKEGQLKFLYHYEKKEKCKCCGKVSNYFDKKQ